MKYFHLILLTLIFNQLHASTDRSDKRRAIVAMYNAAIAQQPDTSKSEKPDVTTLETKVQKYSMAEIACCPLTDMWACVTHFTLK